MRLLKGPDLGLPTDILWGEKGNERKEEEGDSPAPGRIRTHNLLSFGLKACTLPLCDNRCPVFHLCLNNCMIAHLKIITLSITI